MTSTEFTAGIGDSARVSSKVLKPPGGGSSDIFGVGNAYGGSSEKQSANDTTHSRLFGDPSDPLPAAPQKKNTLHKSSIFENGDQPPPSRGKKMFAPEDTATAPSKPAPVQTSIRVRNPPGGKSSGIF